MNEIIWVTIGVLSALLGTILVYLIQVYLRIHMNKKKIKNALVQIRGQVDIKHDLLKEYIDINKDSIDEAKIEEMSAKLNSYTLKSNKTVDILKDYNSVYVSFMNSFDDSLLINQCKDSEKKIGYIKEYYNELVDDYNSYKSNGVKSILTKIASIDDEVLY